MWKLNNSRRLLLDLNKKELKLLMTLQKERGSLEYTKELMTFFRSL